MTFRAISRFSGFSWARVWLLQGLTIFLATVVMVWFLRVHWLTPLESAVSALPNQGEITTGRLHWFGASPLRLNEDSFLSVVVDPVGERDLGQIADLQLEFRNDRVLLYSLLGYTEIA